jgi:hypothetical protein
MTLSRLTPPLLLLLAPAGLFAAPRITAEQAMTNYRKVLKPVRELDCPRGAGGEEIVVCGRWPDQPDPNRLPLPVEPEAGERTRYAPGELPAAEAGRTPAYCFRLCPGYVGVDIQTGKKAVAAIKRALEGDDE